MHEATDPHIEAGYRKWARQLDAWLAVLSVIACLGLVACGRGGADVGADVYLGHHLRGQPSGPWAGKTGPTVAELKLPHGVAITFLIVECRPHKPQCHQVEYYTESPFTHEPGYGEPERTLNEGPHVNHPDPFEHEAFNKVLDLPLVGYLCEGPYAIAPVDALLRQPKDTVTDRSRGQTVRLNKAPIPAQFHPEGVLVYGLLPPHANTIVVKDPAGRVVARDRELGADEEPHFKGANTPRHCGIP